MFETKYSKFLTILLIIIIVAIIGILGYLGFSYFKNYSIKNDANEFVSSFAEEASKSTDKSVDVGDSNDILDGIAASGGDTANASKKVQTYKGYEIVGTIEIPKTKISYPVFKDPPTVKKLELSVATIYPQNAELNKEGNVVIVGHNYRNGSFFSDNKKLSNGDKIYLTDLDGTKISYSIYNVFIASKDDTSFYNRDTDGAKELTLSTCADDDTSQRVIVEAKAD